MVPDRRNRIRPHLSWPAGTAGNGFSPKGGFPADPDKPLPRPAPPSGRLHGRELADTMRKLEHEFRESPLPFHVASARRGLYLIVKPFLRAPDKGGWFEVPFKRLEIAGAEVVASPTTGADGAATWFVPREQKADVVRKGDHPLAHANFRNDFINHMGSEAHHAFSIARIAQAGLLAGKCYDQ